MDRDSDLSQRLQNMPRPEVAAQAMKAGLKLALVSARTSSRVGIALVCLPALFLFGIVLQYGFGVPVPGLGAAESILVWLESMPYLSPLVLVGAPLAALCLNLLAILHVELQRERREVLITLKLRVVNLLIALTALLVVTLVFAHALSERAHHLR